MNNNLPTIKSFKDLRCWQLAHQLTLTIYKLSATFPKQEQFGLTSQIRRAAVSVESNIAEGYARRGKAEKIQFLFITLGSLSEVECQLTIAKDLDFLNQAQFNKINETIQEQEKQQTA